MISKSSTWTWIRNMIEAGYSDKELTSIINEQYKAATLQAKRQYDLDMEILNAIIKERNNHD